MLTLLISKPRGILRSHPVFVVHAATRPGHGSNRLSASLITAILKLKINAAERRRARVSSSLVACRYYSITSSARTRIDCGMGKSSAFAVFMFTTSCIFVTCCTGSSAGFSP